MKLRLHDWRRNAAMGIAIIGLFVAMVFPMRHDLAWIDPVTGSMKTEARWLGLDSKTSIKTSAIEDWINCHESQHTSDWWFLHDDSSTLLGQEAFACGIAPEIHELALAELNDAFVRHSSDQELHEFVKTMRSGDRTAKQKAVQVAVRKAFGVDAAATSTP